MIYKIPSKQLKNHVYLLRFGHKSALLLKRKKVTRKGHFPCPAETGPYGEFEICSLFNSFSQNRFSFCHMHCGMSALFSLSSYHWKPSLCEFVYSSGITISQTNGVLVPADTSLSDVVSTHWQLAGGWGGLYLDSWIHNFHIYN